MFRRCVAYSSESGTNHTAGQTNIFERRQVTPGLVGEILLQQVVHTQQATKGSAFNADGCFFTLCSHWSAIQIEAELKLGVKLDVKWIL